MKVLIDGKEHNLLPDSSGLVKITFTKQTKDAIEIGELEDCSGTTLIDEIQIEQGEQATPYEEPNLILGNATGLISEIRGLEYAISDPKTGLRSQITMLAQGFEQEVSDAIGNYSVQGQTVNGLFAEISKVNGNVNRIIQNADGTSQLITNLNNDYQSLKSTANLYERIIGSTDDEINKNVSRIIQTSDVIQMEVAKMDLATNEALTSKITQLADNINLKVSSGDLLSQINVQANGVLITSGTNKLNITPETTYIQDATIKSAMIASLEADKITTGTLDAGKVKVINIDANNITANKTEFIKSTWNDINSEVMIDGSGIKTTNINGDFSRIVSGELRSFNADSSSTAILGSGRSQYFDKNGSQFILGNTLGGTDWLNSGTLQVTHNRSFAIGRYDDYSVNNGNFHPYISLEYPPNKYGVEPMGIVRFYKSVYLQKDMYANNNAVTGLSKITFNNGGNIESQPNTSNMLIEASNKLIVYASGKNAFEIDSEYMYLNRNLSMEGNNITNQSDIRLKTNIVDTPVDSLSAISGWDFKAFDRVNNGNHDDIGLIAQDTSEIVVYDEENDIFNVNSSKQIMMNSHGIQQLNTKVDNKVEQLEAKIASLQEELAQLKGD